MTERVKDEQHHLRIAPAAAPSHDSSRVDSYGIGVRIDPAHPLPSQLTTREPEWQELEHFVGTRTPEPAVAPEPHDSLRIDTHYLNDINQRVLAQQAQLDTQKSAVIQREQALRQQQIEFDDEQQRSAQRLANEQNQLDARKSQFQKNEAAFHDRLIAFEVQSHKFEAESELLRQQRIELDRQRQSVREDLLAELRSDRTELEQAKADLQKDLDHVHVLKAALDARIGGLAEENAQALKFEREKLWQSLNQEWEQKSQQLQQKQDEWAKVRSAEKSDLDRETAMFESAVESANAEFLKAREALKLELAATRETHAGQLHAEQAEWEKARTTQQAQLALLAKSHQNELLASRAALQLEFDALREQQAASFEQEREDWERIKRDEEAAFETLRDALEQELNELREHQINSLNLSKTEWEELRDREKSRLLEEKSKLFASREAFEVEMMASREQHEASLRAAQQEWQQARDRQNEIVEAQRAELLASCQALEIDMIAMREQHDLMLTSERDDWEQTRIRELTDLESQKTELIAACEALQQELVSQREHHDTLLATEKSEWHETHTRAKSEFESQQAQWFASRDATLQASRDALELDFIALREQHSATLQAERREWDQIVAREKALLEQRQAELIRERTLIENRIRFQQDHLDKSRLELEQAQNEYRRERQVERQRHEDASMLMIRRLRQIDLYRSSIDAREKSLDREHEVFSKTRKALSSTADLDRLNLQAERNAWEQDRQIQQQELRRQQEVLATRAESLESRRTRLDKLRAELEETHRATLEMRLAVEEAWAQLTNVAGQDDARLRVEQVRQSLMGYYQQMQETTAEQRREHVEAQSKFERQRAEFTDERQKMTAWITGRDEEMRLGEERLRIAARDAAANHTKWLAARDKWLVEKTEAEQLIRRLLASLGENNREQSTEAEMRLGLNEISVPTEDVFRNLNR